MKTQLKRSLYVFILLTIIAASAKAQSPSSRRRSVIDSLQITNSDEVKLCTLYDDAITEYIRRVQIFLTDPSKLKSADIDKIDKQFSDQSKELKPKMKDLENTLKTNTTELMKFEQFSMYESRRLMPVMQQFARLKMSAH